MLYTLFQLLTRRDLSKDNPSSSAPSYRLGSFRPGDSGGRKSKKFRHPLSVPNDTAMGSDERIVVPDANRVRAKAVVPGERGREEKQGITVQTELSVRSTQEEQTREARGHYGFPERSLYNQINV